MSEQTKKDIQQVKRFFEAVESESNQIKRIAPAGDKELATKIQKVQESAREVVTHIEKKSG